MPEHSVPFRTLCASQISGTARSTSEAEELDEEDMLAAMVQSAALRQEQPAAATADPDGGADSHAPGSNAGGSDSGDADEDSSPTRKDGHAHGATPPDDPDAAAATDLGGGDSQMQNGAAKPGSLPQAKQAKGRRRGSQKGAAEEAKQPELACSVCSQEFSSRTKLFAHISQTGHARPKAR